jgi:type II secretory pathway component PulF
LLFRERLSLRLLGIAGKPSCSSGGSAVSGGGRSATGVTLGELAALDAEIAALVRAGVPLERGLGEVGRDLPGRLGRLAAELAERCRAGEPLLQVLSGGAVRLPPVYRAVVEAGLRAGRLPAALESLATSLRRLDEARRTIVAAAFYPLVVFVLAWGLLAVSAALVAPRMASMMRDVGAPGAEAVAWAASWGGSAVWWGVAVPAVVVPLAVAWWFFARRAGLVESGSSARILGWLPWAGALAGASRTALFAETLALLVENDVPLPEALPLAGETAGDARLASAARQVAEWVGGGQLGSPPEPPGRRGLPPLVLWPIVSRQPQAMLLPALRRAAETYRRRAERHAGALRVYLPVVLTLCAGGGITVAYALAVMWPYFTILENIDRVR